MIQCIIFDMDGVLINTEPVHFSIWKQICAEQGFELEYEVYESCIGSTVAYLQDLLQRAYGFSCRDNPEIQNRFAELKAEYYEKNGLPEIAGAADAVRTLRSMGYTLAVASSSSPGYISSAMAKLGIADCFQMMFSGELVKHPKPAPDVFLETARQLGVQPADCLVIEDSCNGSRAARAAGMACLGFINPDSGHQDLSAADDTFDSYGQLAEKVRRWDE